MKYTILIEKTDDGWYAAQCEEIPAAITQGKTIEEVKENMKDAILMLLEDEKEDAKKRNEGKNIIRRKISIV
jgi:predicted RNase H-like HicB family nuclease